MLEICSVNETSSRDTQKTHNPSLISIPLVMSTTEASPSNGEARSAQKQAERGSKRPDNKFDPSSQAPSDDPIEIRRQVEFYFSNSNLPMDKFLLQRVGGTENKPVEISIIHAFGRMKRFQSLSAIVAALKDSEILDVIDDKYVRRKVALEKPALEKGILGGRQWVERNSASRSIYVVQSPGLSTRLVVSH